MTLGYGLKTDCQAPDPRRGASAEALCDAPMAWSRSTGWSPSTVRSVLTRETYRGVVVWNSTRKKNDWGKWAPTDRPESEWIRTNGAAPPHY